MKGIGAQALWPVPVAIFAFGAVGKLWEGSFADYLAASGYFPAVIVPFAATAVIAAELIAALLLISPWTRDLGWLLTAGVSGAFTTVHFAALLLGDPRGCDCLLVRISNDARVDHVAMLVLCLVLLALALANARHPATGAATPGRAVP